MVEEQTICLLFVILGAGHRIRTCIESFLCRITNPVLSAVQPSQHNCGTLQFPNNKAKSIAPGPSCQIYLANWFKSFD